MFLWENLTDEELLNWRICDLKLKIEGTDLEVRIAELKQELLDKGLVFQPSCFLGDEWFCPDEVPIIAIPFYLANARLKQLEKKMILEVEGGTKESCMRLLRHEAGHAINYAYLLHKKKRWGELFGAFSTNYPDTYRPQPYSKRFVRNLENWYAQYHPDEDFAETFAVWLEPQSNWREKYKGWKAIEKLEYVEELMKEIAGVPPLVKGGKKMCDASKLKQKLSTYYSRKRLAYAEDMPGFYDSDLKRIFSDIAAEATHETAAAFLRKNRLTITDSVYLWTEGKKIMISRLLKNLTMRCRELKLYRRYDEGLTLMHVSTFLTSMVTNYLFTGKLKRHL